MRIMIVDGGGRGQAFGRKLFNEGHEIFMSPGNPGSEDFAQDTGLARTDLAGQLDFAKRNKVDLTLATADAPLAMGIVDTFQTEGLRIFGPTKAQSRIEWDRDWTKQLGRRLGTPTGAYAVFSSVKEALPHAQNKDRVYPLFAKLNGLADGKGAKECESYQALEQELKQLDQQGLISDENPIVIEDNVPGPESSLHAFCDGKTALAVPFLLRDHKRIGEGDVGLMTGGMGVGGPLDYSPEEVQALRAEFVDPMVKEVGFKGVDFAGLKGEKGQEKLLEHNARPGDPEMPAYLTLLKSPLLPLLEACVDGTLDQVEEPVWDLDKAVISLILAAPGYPGQPEKGAVIEGLPAAQAMSGVQLYHAGTARAGEDLVTNGGRVLAIICTAKTFEEARERALLAASKITFGGQSPQLRRDIGIW